MITAKDIMCCICTTITSFFTCNYMYDKMENKDSFVMLVCVLVCLATWAGRHDFFVAEKKD